MKFTTLPPGLPARHPAAWLATWFFTGLMPTAPGSWGSLAALPFAWAIAVWLSPWALLPAAAAVFLLGVWAANTYMRHGGAHDPGAIVIDEVAGQWLTLAAVPPDPVLYGLGFVFFRAADIVKPWPVGWLDRHVEGGLGVMMDDMLAGVYAGAALWLSAVFLLPLIGV